MDPGRVPDDATQNGIVLALDGARLDALELILGGLVAPIDGYCVPGRSPEGWPFEATLVVREDAFGAAGPGSSVVLTDPDGTPLARLTVTGSERDERGGFSLAGRLAALKAPEHPPARELRLSVADDLAGATVAVFTDVPDAPSVARAVAEASGGPLVFLAVAANRAHNDYSISKTLAVLQRCAEAVPQSRVRFLAAASLDGVTPVADVVQYVLERLAPRAVLDFSATSGTVGAAGAVDATFRPGDASATESEGCVVLLSGLSGSGKSTVARALSERLRGDGRRSVLLDGDDVRRVLSAGLGFSQADREANLERIGWVAARIASVGGLAICAPIAPFETTRARMRAMAEEVGRFVLVYVATPLEVCEQRDRKGLYARARAGELRDFTGIDSPYEAPTDADLVIDTSTITVEQSVDAIETLLRTR